MRRLHLPTLHRRPKGCAVCPDDAACRFENGVCQNCGSRLVDLTRDTMRARDPRY
jgi:hypothetical protein